VIKPRDSFRYGCNGWKSRLRRPLKHEYRDTKDSRCGNLGVRSVTTTVLRNDRVDGEGFQQLSVAGLGERTPGEDVLGMRYIERRLHRIDTADEVVMLRSAAERSQLLPADREEDTPWLAAQGTNGTLRVRDCHPEITLVCEPGRPAQTQDGRGGLRSRHRCVGRNGLGIRMGSINQKVDILGAQIVSKSCGAAESADPDWNGLRGRHCSSAGKRYCRGEVARSERYGELASLRGSAQNQDFRAHG
jgi:hypothetical protein